MTLHRNHIHRLISLLIIGLTIIIPISCKKQLSQAKQNEIQRLRTAGLDALNKAKPDSAHKIADMLLDATRFDQNANNHCAAIYGRIIQGQAYFLQDSLQQSYALLHEAENLCIKHRNDSALASVCNGLGLYYMNVENDSKQALSHLFRGLEAAKNAKNERLHSILLTNISGVYALGNDPNALRYAMECYYHGKKNHDPFLQYIGAISAAIAYTNSQDYDAAFKYIGEAETLLHKHDINDISNFNYSYGRLHELTGNDREAQYYYEQAINTTDLARRDTRAYTALADMYLSKGNTAKSEQLLREALHATNTGHDRLFRHDIMSSLYRTLERQGRHSESDKVRRQIHFEDSVAKYNANRVMIDHLRLKYDIERTENEIERQKSELKYNQTVIYMMIWISIIIIFSAGYFYVLYRRKSALYTAIVRQASESALSEESLRQTIKQLEDEIQATRSSAVNTAPLRDDTDIEKPTSSADDSASKDISDTLRAQFEALMQDKNVYTDNTISKEKVAKMLCTNRTYISKLVNTVYNMTFTEFINSLRIKESIRRLSDTTDEIALKQLSDELGYNSMTTFYNKFKEETGMTPAAFRQKAKSMAKSVSK